jgi:hypothetical protein
MNYFQRCRQLKSLVSYDPDRIEVDSATTVHNFTFHSRHTSLLPESPAGAEPGRDLLDVEDRQVSENASFRYHVFHPNGSGPSAEMLLMFHGFNERHWDKYLPWAARLVESTGKTVVLFPIAFLMNRSPASWSDTRLMHAASKRRQVEYPDVIDSSLLNAAISTRLQRNPQRFIWSGLQTYYDVLGFLESCRNGEHPLFRADFHVDIMAYSIGCFLSEILLLANPEGFFSASRAFLFCGGPVFNRISPVSRFILDSEANVRLYSFLVEHLESHIRHDEKLGRYLNTESGTAFRSMLNYKLMGDFREEKFRAMSGRIAAIGLARDEIMPPYEIANTLKGRNRDIPIPVGTVDFPYPYRHEDPFPAQERFAPEVDESFNRVFDEISGFLTGQTP